MLTLRTAFPASQTGVYPKKRQMDFLSPFSFLPLIVQRLIATFRCISFLLPISQVYEDRLFELAIFLIYARCALI
jgi:hypothetical protein